MNFFIRKIIFFNLLLLSISCYAQQSDNDCINDTLTLNSALSNYNIASTCLTIKILGNDYADDGFKNIKIEQGDRSKEFSNFFLTKARGNIYFLKIEDRLKFNQDSIVFDIDRKLPLKITLLPIQKQFTISFIPEPKIDTPKEEILSLTSNNKLVSYSFPNGQNILQDANTLLKNNSMSHRKDVLSKYSIATLDSQLFLSNVVITGNHSSSGIQPNLFKGGNILKTDVTNFATGMSRFLVDRAKQELNEAFFQRMYKEMDKMADLQFLFPESYFFLRQINAHNIQLNLEQLKTKFEEDIKNLPSNLYNAKGSLGEKYAFLNKLNAFLETEEGQWVDLALYILTSNNGKINPKELFEMVIHSGQFATLESRFGGHIYAKGNEKSANNSSEFKEYSSAIQVQKGKLNFLNTFKLAELISNSLLSPDPNRYWVTSEEFNELMSNDSLFETYIGLLLAKSELDNYKINFFIKDGKAESLKSLVENAYKAGKDAKLYLQNLKSMIRDLYNSFAQIDELGQKLKAANSSDELISEIHKYYTVLKNNVNAISNHLGYRNILGSQIGLNIDNAPLFDYIVPCIDIAYNIKTKQYNLAISNTISLLYTISEKIDSKDKKTAAVLKKFVHYGTLIGNVANAQTSDEVKAAIEASVLPVGSSRIKRHSRYSISLNAYVGAFYGQGFYKEEIGGILENKTVQTFGITAPIGISFNMGSLGFREKSALSLTMQVIDLGALVNFYAKNGDGASLPANTKIQLGDILAPGAQLSYSLGDSPFSLIAGVQYVPNLSRMTEISTNTNFTPIAYRAQFGLVIDIPLFNLKVWEK